MTLSSLSEAILLTASALVPGSDSEATARLLYHGNWLPLAPAWLARFPDDHAVARYVVGDAATRGTLRGRWLRSQDATWIHWNAGHRRIAAGPFKVYVSVVPDDLPVAFERCLSIFEEQRTTSFKLSRHPRGLLRPDRFVAYCSTRTETDQLATSLTDALVGLRPQGVPFTAEAGNPAVSWARDPAGQVTAYAPSWRGWVTRKLAAYLHASDAPDPLGRASFARARVRHDGVDPDAWSPRDDLWDQR